METEPPIWRRLQAASTVNLRRLHDVLQVAFGWTQSHLYEFEIGGVTYGEPNPEWEWPVNRARATQLRRVAPEPGVTYPRCVDGARSGPPEDVGGV